MAKQICEIVARYAHDVFVEPFAGGASVFWHKPPSRKEVLNDTLDEIVNFYRVLRDDASELRRVLELTPYARSEHAACRAADLTHATALERARNFHVRMTQSFGGKFDGGWGTTRLAHVDQAATTARKVDAIAAHAQRLRGVCVENLDALVCIDKYDSADALFFVDPPYVGTHLGHYGRYTQSDFDDLIARLKIVRGAVVLTCYAELDLTGWTCDTKVSCASNGKPGTRDRIERIYHRPASVV